MLDMRKLFSIYLYYL